MLAETNNLDVVIAIVSGVVAVAVGLLGLLASVLKLRKENRQQHEDNKNVLMHGVGEMKGMMTVIHENVISVRDRLNDHIDNHHEITNNITNIAPTRRSRTKKVQ